MEGAHPKTGIEADDAVMKYIGRSTACLMFGERKNRPEEMGSGTLMRAASGTPVVLTARHVVEGLGHLSLCVVGRHVPDDLWASSFEVRCHPNDDVDVALVVLRGAEGLASLCVGADALAGEARSREDKEGYVLTGCPDQISAERKTTDGKKLDILRGSIVYGTNLLGRDDRRLSLDFRQAAARGDVPPMADVEVGPSGAFELKKPNTISGGAVWRVRPPTDLIWTPEAADRIVGVAVEYTRRRSELAEPIERWGDWVRSELAG